MAVTKKFLKSKPVCKVTFTLPNVEAEAVSLVGDFNEWDASATPLKKLKNGNFKVVVDLATKKSYEYKFIVDGEYTNDDAAEASVWNEYANAENSVVAL